MNRIIELQIARAFFIFITICIALIGVLFEMEVSKTVVFDRTILYPAIIAGFAISLFLVILVSRDIKQYRNNN